MAKAHSYRAPHWADMVPSAGDTQQVALGEPGGVVRILLASLEYSILSLDARSQCPHWGAFRDPIASRHGEGGAAGFHLAGFYAIYDWEQGLRNMRPGFFSTGIR